MSYADFSNDFITFQQAMCYLVCAPLLDSHGNETEKQKILSFPCLGVQVPSPPTV